MKLDTILNANRVMRIQRPPVLWEVDGDEALLTRMVNEMITVGLRSGERLEHLTLNANNVVVEPDVDEPESQRIPTGEYVALTITGGGSWGREVAWHDGEPLDDTDYGEVMRAMQAAGARSAYTRILVVGGAITVLLPRMTGP